MPAPGAEPAVSSPPEIELKEAQDNIMIPRVAEYLPEKPVQKTGNTKAIETFRNISWMQFSGTFLSLADNVITSDKGVTTGTKENLVNECTNMGLIAALMLTIVLPFSFDNINDWLEEDFPGSGFGFMDGYIGQQLTSSGIENAIGGLNDFTLVCYALSSCGFLVATGLPVLMLLCLGELGTDAGCEEFLRRVGHMTRAPYTLFVAGAFIGTVPSAVRYVLTVKTLPGLILVLIVIVTMTILCLVYTYSYVAGCVRAHNCINEFEELSLSNSEAQQDVETWFEKSGKTRGSVEDCLLDLSGIVVNPSQNSELIVNLDSFSRQCVALHYHKLRAESLGIALSQTDLYNLSCQALQAA
ncbi:unnamed protein product [Symbiodinium microadriaticum]|nr:unnamed protein product [Symbiodinium microadriaticum]CAE7334759.1 unnamed protein product [Symbiodinium sp. KB8]